MPTAAPQVEAAMAPETQSRYPIPSLQLQTAASLLARQAPYSPFALHDWKPLKFYQGDMGDRWLVGFSRHQALVFGQHTEQSGPRVLVTNVLLSKRRAMRGKGPRGAKTVDAGAGGGVMGGV
jgi:hypothetical protein